ncbi:MAG: site-2 protease family protein [Planctomycetota bacterium]
MAEFFSTTQGIIMVILGLGIIVFIHELGHFIVAKRSGIRVEKFYLFFDAYGIKLFKFKKGDTEYGIGWLPLGGYVKLAGENITSPDIKNLPDEFISKPPLTRAKVFMAGALMNFILAFPLCIISYLIGLNLMAPSVGEIQRGSSEWNSSLQKGDIILSIIKPSADGNVIEYPIKNHNDYRREIIRIPAGTPLKLKVKRPDYAEASSGGPARRSFNAGGKEMLIAIVARGSSGLGVLPSSNVIKSIQPGSAADKAGLKANDEILEVNGESTLSAGEISSKISQRPELPTPMKIRNPDGEIRIITAIPATEKLTEPYYNIGIDGIMPVIIAETRKDSPAANAGIQKGDRIVTVNNSPIKSWNKFAEIIKASAGKNLELTIIQENNLPARTDGRSGGSTSECITLTVSVASDPAGQGYIGIVPLINNEIGETKDNSSLSGIGLSYGDKIIKATGKNEKGKTLEVNISALTQLQDLATQTKSNSIELTVAKNLTDLPDRQSGPITKTIQVTPKQLSEIGTLGIGLTFKSVLTKYPLGTAIVEGSKETLDLGLFTFQAIKQLFKGQEPLSGLAGPIGIIQVIYRTAHEGISLFLWLLSLISINLAILNILPIPVLDGGGILFCLIEKIKGAPASLKIQVIAQYIGLFLLLSMVVLATINDILR